MGKTEGKQRKHSMNCRPHCVAYSPASCSLRAYTVHLFLKRRGSGIVRQGDFEMPHPARADFASDIRSWPGAVGAGVIIPSVCI